MLVFLDISFYAIFALAVIIASVRKSLRMPYVALVVITPWIYTTWVDMSSVGIPYISASISFALAVAFMAIHPQGGVIKILLAILFILALVVNALCFFYAFGDRLYYSRLTMVTGLGQILLLLFSERIRNMRWYDITTRALMDGRYSNFMSRYWVSSDMDNILTKGKE